MKSIIILALAILTQLATAQSVENGTYRSTFTSFQNYEDSSKNYNMPVDSFILVEIYDEPTTRGGVSITNKTEDGDSVTIKFMVNSRKQYYYEDGNTYLYYKGYISVLGVDTNQKCTIAFDVNDKLLIIMYEKGSTQSWDLNRI